MEYTLLPARWLYIEFEDESIYQIHGTKISVEINQGILSGGGMRFTGGINSDKTPIHINASHNNTNCCVMSEREEYTLTFKNKLTPELIDKFYKQSFTVGKIRFNLIGSTENNHIATGYLDNLKDKDGL